MQNKNGVTMMRANTKYQNYQNRSVVSLHKCRHSACSFYTPSCQSRFPTFSIVCYNLYSNYSGGENKTLCILEGFLWQRMNKYIKNRTLVVL